MAINIPGQLRDPYGKVQLDTAVTTEPLTLSEAKAHLRVTSSSDDAYISTLITVARELVEKETRQIWTAATYKVSYDTFPGTDTIIIPDITNIASITSLQYFDNNANDLTWPSSNYYLASTLPCRIVKKTASSWPSTDSQPDNVRLKLVTATPTGGVPKPLLQAMLLIIGHFYENRQEVADRIYYTMPKASEFLLTPYRNTQI